MQMATSTSDAQQHDAEQLQPWPLRLLLPVLGLACIAWFFSANSRTEEFYFAYPTLEPWSWNLYLTCPIVALVGMFALWSRHRWGFWLIVVVAVIAAGVELSTMGFSIRMLMIPALVGAVWLIAQPVWSSLH